MQPERIKGESQGAPTSYTASSDVWSLGLSIIEFAIGHYPYPPETYSNVFAQLTAIVHGEPPVLPAEYSDSAREFVRACLRKVAGKRPTYAQLMVSPLDPTSSRRILTRRNLGPSVLEGRHWTRSRHGRLDRRCARLPREAPQDLYSRPRLRRRPRPSFLSLSIYTSKHSGLEPPSPLSLDHSPTHETPQVVQHSIDIPTPHTLPPSSIPFPIPFSVGSDSSLALYRFVLSFISG
jgi:serine/threonine protein kinase